jgi:hypothetical protein
MTMIFIGASLGKTILGSISHRTLHNYNVEFQVELVFFLIYETSLLVFLSFRIFFCNNDIVSNGRGDGHSSNSMRWRKNNLFQEFVDLRHSLQVMFLYCVRLVDFIIINCHEGWHGSFSIVSISIGGLPFPLLHACSCEIRFGCTESMFTWQRNMFLKINHKE